MGRRCIHQIDSGQDNDIKHRTESPKTVEPVVPEIKNDAPTPVARNGRGTKQFRVRIVGYTETLQPTEVATLLRLGNQVSLKTARLSSETVYFTDTFDSLNAAKDALSLCIKRGFNDAEIEVLYE